MAGCLGGFLRRVAASTNGFWACELDALVRLNSNPNPVVANNFKGRAFVELPGFHVFALGFIANGDLLDQFALLAGLEFFLRLSRRSHEHHRANMKTHALNADGWFRPVMVLPFRSISRKP